MNLRQRIQQRFDPQPIETQLHAFEPLLAEIRAIEAELSQRNDAELQLMAGLLKSEATRGKSLEEMLVVAYALVSETAFRTLGMRPYDVQIIAAIALHQGKVIEMHTGEGKTLTATLPAFLNALPGTGVHLLTFNDYLARRDAEWMGPVYRFLGLKVGWISEEMDANARREAYQNDLVYLTAKQGGFDYLRNSLIMEPEEEVLPKAQFALIDEVDSILIDEARIPLVIAGADPQSQGHGYPEIVGIIKELLPETHFEIDEYGLNIFLTDEGIQFVEERLGIPNLYEAAHEESLVKVNQCLQAEWLLKRDVDYIVRQGKIWLVDEFSGRIVEDRKWPHGLQAAMEAKENLIIQPGGKVLGKTTLQHFIGTYPKRAGMTGTAVAAATEFKELYGMSVTVIPPNRPNQRIDHPDVILPTKETKWRTLTWEILKVHQTGRPILVGTASIRESEALAARLTESEVSFALLNAKNDEAEAAIVADAGKWGAVTISTNMAGRGTDIQLGGKSADRRDEIVQLGGLYVIGTNRFESKRIDNQLRGRAGRQGDPGSSRFFISLKDDLLQKHGIYDLIPRRFRKQTELGTITHEVIRKEVERVQRIVESQNFEKRRTLWKYADFVEGHRKIIREKRQAWLFGEFESRWALIKGERYHRWLKEFGPEVVRKAERLISLAIADKLWAEYLEDIDQIRQSIHLVVIGGRDPMMEFQERSVALFDVFLLNLDTQIDHRLSTVTLNAEGIDLAKEGLNRPGSTWTYLVSDNPFGDRLEMMLVSNSNFGFVAFAAFWWPLVAMYFLTKKIFRKKD